MRRYALFGCRNLRPVGGYPLPGGTASENAFFRCDLPLYVGEEEERFLKDYYIRTVIDLRDQAETEAKVDALRDCPLVSWHHVPLGGVIPTQEDGIPASYVDYAHNRTAMARTLELLSGGGACLFHCAAGKDRTGVVAAVLMWAAGAADEDLVADYRVSETFIRPILEDLRRVRPDLPAFAGRSRANYMERFFAALTGEFSTPADYLAWLGLGADTADRLTEKARSGL